eukprot:214284_1
MALYLLLICTICRRVSYAQYTNIWHDDCDSQGSWLCHGDPTGECSFGRTESHYGQCESTKCHRVTGPHSWITKETDISQYTASNFLIILYVDYTSHSNGDKCQVKYRYDSGSFGDCYVCEDGVGTGCIEKANVTIAVPANSGKRTLTLALGILSQGSSTHCQFDSITLKYLPEPTSQATSNPTTSNPTENSTSLPTRDPSFASVDQPSVLPTHLPTKHDFNEAEVIELTATTDTDTAPDSDGTDPIDNTNILKTLRILRDPIGLIVFIMSVVFACCIICIVLFLCRQRHSKKADVTEIAMVNCNNCIVQDVSSVVPVDDNDIGVVEGRKEGAYHIKGHVLDTMGGNYNVAAEFVIKGDDEMGETIQ